MECSVQDIKLLQTYYKKLKKDSKLITYIKLPDRLQVSFKYNDISEIIEFLDCRVICYGTLGTYSFNLNNVNKIPSNFYPFIAQYGIEGQLAILDKIDTINNIIIYYDPKLAMKQFYQFLKSKDLYESYINLSKDSKNTIIASLEFNQSLANSSTIVSKIVDLLVKYGLLCESETTDAWYALGESLGLRYTSKILLLVVVLTLVSEDYTRKYI